MIEFRPDTLYSIVELRSLLHGTVELDTLLDRLGLRDRRVFRDALWGWEILEAARRAPAFSEGAPPRARDSVRSARVRPRGRPSTATERPGKASSEARASTRRLGAADLLEDNPPTR